MNPRSLATFSVDLEVLDEPAAPSVVGSLVGKGLFKRLGLDLPPPDPIRSLQEFVLGGRQLDEELGGLVDQEFRRAGRELVRMTDTDREPVPGKDVRVLRLPREVEPIEVQESTMVGAVVERLRIRAPPSRSARVMSMPRFPNFATGVQSCFSGSC